MWYFAIGKRLITDFLYLVSFAPQNVFYVNILKVHTMWMSVRLVGPNMLDFWPKINMFKENCCILWIDIIQGWKKLGIHLGNKVLQNCELFIKICWNQNNLIFSHSRNTIISLTISIVDPPKRNLHNRTDTIYHNLISSTYLRRQLHEQYLPKYHIENHFIYTFERFFTTLYRCKCTK